MTAPATLDLGALGAPPRARLHATPDAAAQTPRASLAAPGPSPVPPQRDLLARLWERPPQGAGDDRADRYLAGGLRAWLEDVAAGVGRHQLADLPAGGPARAGADLAAGRQALGATVFRLVVSGCRPSHPYEQARLAVDAAGAAPLGRLGARDRAALRAAVRADARHTLSQWRRVPADLLPRTAERVQVPLAGGEVVLAVTADLVVGRAGDGGSSVCLLQVRVACPPASGRRQRRLLALLETLRSGAPPRRVATYDPGSGAFFLDEVTEALLADAVGDVAIALHPPNARLRACGAAR